MTTQSRILRFSLWWAAFDRSPRVLVALISLIAAAALSINLWPREPSTDVGLLNLVDITAIGLVALRFRSNLPPLIAVVALLVPCGLLAEIVWMSRPGTDSLVPWIGAALNAKLAVSLFLVARILFEAGGRAFARPPAGSRTRSKRP